jgi:hypothetical protein
VTLDHGRIGIAGSVLFAFNSADQPEGRQLLKSLAAPLGAYLKARDEVLMVSGFTDDRPCAGGKAGAARAPGATLADNWELSAQRALTVTRALIEEACRPPCLCRRLRRAAAGGLQRRCRGPGPQPPGGDGADGAAGPRQRRPHPRLPRRPRPPPAMAESWSPEAELAALRAAGLDQADPVRFAYLQALARRLPAQPARAQALLAERLQAGRAARACARARPPPPSAPAQAGGWRACWRSWSSVRRGGCRHSGPGRPGRSPAAAHRTAVAGRAEIGAPFPPGLEAAERRAAPGPVARGLAAERRAAQLPAPGAQGAAADAPALAGLFRALRGSGGWPDVAGAGPGRGRSARAGQRPPRR